MSSSPSRSLYLRVLNAFCLSSVQIKSCSTFVASSRALASSTNTGIQRQQNPVVAEAGMGIFSTISLRTSESHLWPFLRTYPRYIITYCLQIWALFAEVLYPRLSGTCCRFSVPFRHFFWLAAAINRLVPGFGLRTHPSAHVGPHQRW